MKKMIVLEEFAYLLLGIFFFYKTDLEWWILPVFLLVPDISIMFYLINNRTGAAAYNIIHHRSISILLFLSGRYFDNIIIEVTGIILFTHSAIDRIFGYGFKYFDSFGHTHLNDS